MRIIILGAGPTGLGAAYHLNKLGYASWRLYERNNHVGGLSASYVDGGGFTWDIGGHVLFSHYDYFDHAVAESLGDSYYVHQRESWVRILQRWVPYPFQNNIRYLPEEVLSECIIGLRNISGHLGKTENFYDWLISVFGSGIVKYFMEPYNRKVWGTPLEIMDKQWIAERVSLVDLARIERNIAEQRDDLSWGPNNKFKFPKYGGTGAIYEGIASSFSERISKEYEMVSIDPLAKLITFSNSTQEPYDVLITTVPVDQLLTSCTAAPEIVREAAADLIYNSGYVCGLGFSGERRDSKCWMYFPESSCPFYRVTNFHNYSRFNVPGGKTNKYYSLMCETTYSRYKPEESSNIMENTIQGLCNSGMINKYEREKIISSYLINVPYSYPVPTLGRDRALSIIQPWLESVDIYSRGRFGAWKYEVGNMDHSFMQGVEVVERILNNAFETVINGSVIRL